MPFFKFAFGIILLLMPVLSVAQEEKAEIVPFAGFRFGGGFSGGSYGATDNSPDDLEIADGFQYGLIVALTLSPKIQLEMFYDRMSTELLLREQGGGSSESLFFLNVDYLQFGVLYHFPVDSKPIKPIAGLAIGGTYFGPESRSSGATRVSASAVLGLKYFFNPRVGLRVHSRFLSTFFPANDEIFCIGSDCYQSSGTTFFNQIELATGFIVTF